MLESACRGHGADARRLHLHVAEAAADWRWLRFGGNRLAVALEHADDVSVDWRCA